MGKFTVYSFYSFITLCVEDYSFWSFPDSEVILLFVTDFHCVLVIPVGFFFDNLITQSMTLACLRLSCEFACVYSHSQSLTEPALLAASLSPHLCGWLADL